MSNHKYTVAVDFDGVLHSYSSPWINAHTIPDPPVAGALEWLVRTSGGFAIAINSTRCKSWRGRRAMRAWLRHHLRSIAKDWDSTPAWWPNYISQFAFADPWPDEVDFAITQFLRNVSFPRHKPVALIYLDDRAVRFTGPGSFPSKEAIHRAKPWNKP